MGLKAFVASRLIALNKCPGVRPIGVGEVTRCIIGKAILATISDDIQEQVPNSSVQVSRQVVRQQCMQCKRFWRLLVDASNAFNHLNRQAALHNIQLRCPPLATVLINTYRMEADLFIDGETITSEEGTTQGDPLAMVMYAIGILPLIQRLNHEVKQVWYADDATAGRQIDRLRDWWNNVLKFGPEYEYFANPTKTWLVVKE